MSFKNKKTAFFFTLMFMVFSLIPVVSAEIEPTKVSYGYETASKSIDISPSDRYVAIGYYNGIIRIWDTIDGKNISFTPNNIEKERLISYFGNVPPYVSKIAYSPDDRYLLSASYDYDFLAEKIISAHLIVHDVESGEVIRYHNMSTSSLWDIAFSPDGKTYAALSEMDKESETSSISLWDLESGNLISTIESNNYEATSIAFTPDNKYLVVSYLNYKNPDRIVIFDLNTGTETKVIEELSVSNIQFSDDGRIFVAGSNHINEIIVWDSNTYNEIQRIKCRAIPPNDISLSSKGIFLAVVERSHLMAWNLSSEEKIIDMDSSDQIYEYRCVDFSNDDKYIAVVGALNDDSKYSMDFDTRSESLNIKNIENIPLDYDAIFIYELHDIEASGYKEGILDLFRKIPSDFLGAITGILLIFILFFRERIVKK
jgi:WD40 repeat protein